MRAFCGDKSSAITGERAQFGREGSGLREGVAGGLIYFAMV